MFVAGGLGANPHPAKALEEFTPREHLLATLEAVLRTFDHYGNRDNKLRARLKWLVDTMGIDELRERVLKERKLLWPRPAPGPGASRPWCTSSAMPRPVWPRMSLPPPWAPR